MSKMDAKEIEELKKRVAEQGEERFHHTPYFKTTKRQPDFEVAYRLDPDPELNKVIVRQGIRCDFLYEGDDPEKDGIFMIWPELLNESGDVILDKRVIPDESGKAIMWIGNPETKKEIHRNRIKIGTQGYWVIGNKKLAKVRVTKILSLFED